MTKTVLISLEELEDFSCRYAEDKEISILDRLAVENWFNAQPDMTPTLNAIDGMDLWDALEAYIVEAKDEEESDEESTD